MDNWDTLDSGFNSLLSFSSEMSSSCSEGGTSEDGQDSKDSLGGRVEIGDPCTDYLRNPMFLSLQKKPRKYWDYSKTVENRHTLQGANCKRISRQQINKNMGCDKAVKKCEIL